ncbi:hypothetical protein [Bacillus cihuensis]|uniref:hypothetical protein n=1 Tax=Bacillus cihuensis TaxID=1208599 RepID=UPI00041E487D|nr:hypothetical protein [Bacillus cihuensis]
MKIKELIGILRECDPEAEIKVLFPLPNRPLGGILEPIFDVTPSIDQDLNKTNYVIDTGIGVEERYKTFQQKP